MAKHVYGCKNVVATMQGQAGLKVEAKKMLPITLNFVFVFR